MDTAFCGLTCKHFAFKGKPCIICYLTGLSINSPYSSNGSIIINNTYYYIPWQNIIIIT